MDWLGKIISFVDDTNDDEYITLVGMVKEKLSNNLLYVELLMDAKYAQRPKLHYILSLKQLAYNPIGTQIFNSLEEYNLAVESMEKDIEHKEAEIEDRKINKVVSFVPRKKISLSNIDDEDDGA